MTWDKADFNPFLWEILQPVHMEGGPQKKIYWPVQVRQLRKILLYPWFHPALWPSTLTRERQGEKNRYITYSLWAEAWTWTAEVKYTLRSVGFTLMLENPKETVQRCDCTGWGDRGSFHRLCSQGRNEHPLLFVTSENNHFPWSLFIYPQCYRYFVPTCILTLSSMVRIHQFVEYAVRHRLYSFSHSPSLSQRQEGLCRVSVNHSYSVFCRPVPETACPPPFQTT